MAKGKIGGSRSAETRGEGERAHARAAPATCKSCITTSRGCKVRQTGEKRPPGVKECTDVPRSNSTLDTALTSSPAQKQRNIGSCMSAQVGAAVRKHVVGRTPCLDHADGGGLAARQPPLARARWRTARGCAGPCCIALRMSPMHPRGQGYTRARPTPRTYLQTVTMGILKIRPPVPGCSHVVDDAAVLWCEPQRALLHHCPRRLPVAARFDADGSGKRVTYMGGGWLRVGCRGHARNEMSIVCGVGQHCAAPARPGASASARCATSVVEATMRSGGAGGLVGGWGGLPSLHTG